MWTLIKLEWQRSRNNPLTLLVLVTLSGLLLLAAINGASDVSAMRRALATEQAKSQETQAELQAKASKQTSANADKLARYEVDATNPAIVGGWNGPRRASLPPGDFAAFAVGYSAEVPQSIVVGLTSRHVRDDGYDLSSPATRSAGRFDLALVVVLLLPLFAIALGYDLLSGERENGILRLVSAQPVSLTRLLVSRVLLRLALLTAPLTLSTVGLYLHSASAISAAGLLQCAVLVLAMVLYTAFWLIACACMNLSDKTSSSHALMGITLYLALVVVAPNAVQFASAALSPAPARLHNITALRTLTAEIERGAGTLTETYYHQNTHIAKPGDDKLLKDFRSTLLLRNIELDRRLAPQLAQTQAAELAQASTVRLAAGLLPPLALNALLEQLAGTDREAQVNFDRQLDAFQAKWRDFFMPRVMGGQRLVAADYAQLPVFEFAPPEAFTALKQAQPLLAGLLLMTLLLAGLWTALITFLKPKT